MSESIERISEASSEVSKEKKDKIMDSLDKKSSVETTQNAGNQPRSKCQIIHLVNPNSEQKKQELVSNFEPLLTALEMQPPSSPASNEKVQYYVEVGGNEVLNLKDGVQYTLIQTDDNNFQLCETPIDAKAETNRDSGSWSPVVSLVRQDDTPIKENNDTEGALTPAECNVLKSLNHSQKNQSTPCQGQGDEPGNSIVESTTSLLNSITTGNESSSYSDHQVLDDTVEGPQGTRGEHVYTPIAQPKREKFGNESCVNYQTPRNTIFQHPTFCQSPMSMEPLRFAHNRPRVLYSPDGIPYTFDVRPPSLRGYRQRRPRQAWHPYHTVLHSTPLASSSSSSIDSSSGLSSSISSGSNISLTNSGCSESQDTSPEYPRVPNNTPNSGELAADSRMGAVDPQWGSKLTTQLENMQYYVPVDLRESHNQKERRRRLRIKMACQTLRNLVPGINDRTDKATVFEHVVRYLTFIKEVSNNKYDMEFIEKCYL